MSVDVAVGFHFLEKFRCLLVAVRDQQAVQVQVIRVVVNLHERMNNGRRERERKRKQYLAAGLHEAEQLFDEVHLLVLDECLQDQIQVVKVCARYVRK